VPTRDSGPRGKERREGAAWLLPSLGRARESANGPRGGKTGLQRGKERKGGEERGWALERESREEGFVFIISFPFFYSKSTFKSILKITWKYF